VTPPTPAPVRPTRGDSEPPRPEGGLTVLLWVIAALIALAEFLWWMSERIYSQ
jgi:hypothetical protein